MEDKITKEQYFFTIISDAITEGNEDLFTDEVARLALKITKLLIEELNTI